MRLTGYSERWDLTTIPDDKLKSEKARRNSAKRKTHSGGRNGRPLKCECGKCETCLRRAKRLTQNRLTPTTHPIRG